MTTRCHTFTGTGFDPFNPQAEDVRLEDIAHHLAMTCRYGGACPKFYSVAEHAVRVSDLVLQVTKSHSWALYALHHDSAEAYLHDIRRPIKSRLWFSNGLHDDERGTVCEQFEYLEDAVMGAIYRALFTHEQLWDETNARESIGYADDALLIAEMQSFFGERPEGIQSPMEAALIEKTSNWEAAKSIFLRTHQRLTRRIEDAS